MRRSWLPCLVLACLAAAAFADPPRTSLEAAVVGAYAWRGRVWNDEPALHPGVSLKWSEAAFDLSGVLDLTDEPGAFQRERAEVSARYATQADGHYTAVGAMAYVYTADADERPGDTAELFLVYGADILLLPTITVSYDFLEANGAYVEAAIGHSFEISESVALDCRLALGWADAQYAESLFTMPPDPARGFGGFTPDSSVFTELTIEALLPIRISERLELQPGIAYMTSLDADLRDALCTAGEKTDATIVSLRLTAAL